MDSMEAALSIEQCRTYLGQYADLPDEIIAELRDMIIETFYQLIRIKAEPKCQKQ
jgi:hypothetical protein